MPKIAQRPNHRDSAAEIGKAIAHPVRTDILTVLHEGPASGSSLCRQVGVPWGRLGHHIQTLLDANAIEVAFNETVGSHDITYYRAMTSSTYLKDDLARFGYEQQHELNRVIIQSMTAEALAALSAGYFAGDPLVSAAWNRVPLDQQGYESLESISAEFIDRIYEFAAEAAERTQLTGEVPKTYVGAVLGFRRSRTQPATSAAVEDVGGDLFPVAAEQSSSPRDSTADVGKAIAHPVRTDILTVLHDGPASQSAMSKEIGVKMGALGHHVKALLDANAIEVAFNETVGNHDITYYRALASSTYLADDLARFTYEQQHELNRVIIQSITAEALAALSAGHFAGDPLASAAWNRVPLDQQGYERLSSGCEDFITRLHEITENADERMRVTGEVPKTYVGAVLGFRRSRTEPATSAAVKSSWAP